MTRNTTVLRQLRNVVVVKSANTCEGMISIFERKTETLLSNIELVQGISVVAVEVFWVTGCDVINHFSACILSSSLIDW